MMPELVLHGLKIEIIKNTIRSQSKVLFSNPSTQWKEILTKVTLFSFFSFKNFLTVKKYINYKNSDETESCVFFVAIILPFPLFLSL